MTEQPSRGTVVAWRERDGTHRYALVWMTELWAVLPVTEITGRPPPVEGTNAAPPERQLHRSETMLAWDDRAACGVSHMRRAVIRASSMFRAGAEYRRRWRIIGHAPASLMAQVERAIIREVEASRAEHATKPTRAA